MADNECNVEEILKEINVLDKLKELRAGMNQFEAQFPELTGMETTLDAEIAKQEAALETRVNKCGADLQIPEESEVAAETSEITEPQEA